MTAATSTIFLGLMLGRICAGMLDNTFGTQLAPMASFLVLLFLAFELIWRPIIPRIFIGLVVALLALDLAALISFWFNDVTNPRAAVSYILVTLLYALVATSGARLFCDAKSLRSLYRFCQVLIAVGSMASIYQSLSGSGLASQADPSLIRGFGTAGHPVTFGMQTVITMVLMEICRTRLNLPISKTYALLLILGLIGIYFTYARTAWLMLIILITVYGLVGLKGRSRLLAIFAGVLLLVGLIFASGRFADLADLPAFFANTAFDADRFDPRSVRNSMAWRIANWVLHYRMGWESPLLGFGPGQSRDISLFGLEMHNMFLEVFIEIGLLGLAALLVFLWQIVRLHHLMAVASDASRHVVSLIVGLSLSLLVSAIFSVGFLDQTMGVLLYSLVITLPFFPVEAERGHGVKPA